MARRRWLPPIPDRVYRALMVLLAVALTAAVVRAVFGLGGDPGFERVETTSDAYSVADAISRATSEPLPVGGFVFDDGSFLGTQLCQGIEHGSPPSCIGPALSLRNVDLNRFHLRRSPLDGDRELLYTERPVVVFGDIVGVEMTVREILG